MKFKWSGSYKMKLNTLRKYTQQALLAHTITCILSLTTSSMYIRTAFVKLRKRNDNYNFQGQVGTNAVLIKLCTS